MASSAKSDSIFSRAKKAVKSLVSDINEAQNFNAADYSYGYDAVSVSVLLGSGNQAARSRIQIYEKWHFMSEDPIISSAIKLHVTAALGGDATTGETIFISPTSQTEKKKGKLLQYAQEIKADLEPLFNSVAYQVAFNGAAFGDAYARVYGKDREGVKSLYTDEMVWPPLVQPYERGTRTLGYAVSTGARFVEKLTIKQLARMKMPRQGYIPQIRVMEKAMKIALTQDDTDLLPVLPCLVGGSMLQFAEKPFDYLQTALTGLVGQRIISSIDENIIEANVQNMTEQQREEFMTSLKAMLVASKNRAEKAVKTGQPVTERIFNIIPTIGEKQLTQISAFQGTSGNHQFSMEDVMTYLKMLTGALGIDLSMLGFSEILSGGLGEGGFFRTSAQAAERARMLRTALSQFFNDIIDIHCYYKYGFIFEPGDRPYEVQYAGSISALENEAAESKERTMGATQVMVQTIAQLKDLGLDVATNKQIMTTEMGLDEELAQVISVALEKAKADDAEDMKTKFKNAMSEGDDNKDNEYITEEENEADQ